MDISAFSQEHFDAKEWINGIFQSQEAKNSDDIKLFASSVVMRLQLAIQEVNASVEETSSQIVSTLPRVVRDVEALSHEASILKNQMNNVKKDIDRVEQNTAGSMQALVKLDKLKSNFCASSHALKEADNWTTISSDIEEVMDSGDLAAISSKLNSLQNCLSILSHVPDYEDRVAHLEGLKVRLEALLSPHLVAAFTHHNLEDSMTYSKMLRTLGRSKNLESYYYKCEKQQLQTKWRAGVEGQNMSSSPSWLSSFYEELSVLISKQVKWCEQVFEGSDPILLLADLTRSVLKTLDPPISQVVSVAIKQQEDPFSFLATIKNLGDNFLIDYKEVINSPSLPGEELFKLNVEVFNAVMKPLKDQINSYQDYEESYLLSLLTYSEIAKNDLSENLQFMKDYCKKMVSQTEIAAKRCIQLTGGLAFPAMVKGITTYVVTFNDQVAQISKHVEQQTSSIQDDWTVFNTCLSLIQLAGELLIAVEMMEHSLAASLTNVSSKIAWNLESDPFLLTAEVLLSQPQIAEIKEMLQSVMENDARLLESCLTHGQGLCEKSVDVALNTIMGPISSQLSQVPTLRSWNSKDAQSSSLSSSFSPQEYVTQIGQYLMTLPQHLEPLLVNHSPALNRALQENSLRSSSACQVVSESEVSAADFLISSVGQATCKQYTDVILKIKEVAPNMVTQLTTDVDYICNIFEDLGVISCDPLDKLNILLKVPAAQYWEVVPGNNPRLVAAVRQIRDIPAKS